MKLLSATSVGVAAAWTTPEPITDTLGISDTIHPPIFDDQGTMHLIWHNYLGAGVSEPYRLLYAAYNGTWSPANHLKISEGNIDEQADPPHDRTPKKWTTGRPNWTGMTTCTSFGGPKCRSRAIVPAINPHIQAVLAGRQVPNRGFYKPHSTAGFLLLWLAIFHFDGNT